MAENPGRFADRVHEPSGAPLGEPGDHLSPAEAQLWNEILSQLAPGVALESDRCAFGALIQLESRNRVIILEPPERAQLIRLYGLFGMTPADRSRVSVVPPKPTNEFDDLEAHG